MACKILKVVSFFVCVGHISGQEVVDVRISGAGVVCWDLPDGEQSSLYSEFRLKVVKTAGQGENIVTVSKNCYDLSMLNLTQGEYSVQVQIMSQNGTPVGDYSKPQTYLIKDSGLHGQTLIAILLSAIIGSGVFLGIILLVFVVKKISCYHKTNSPPKDELHGIPDDVDINRAYGIGKRESDDSSHLRVTTNNSYNIENDYTYIDYSVHPQECTQEGKLDETLDETKTATNQQFLLCQDGHDGMTTLHDHSRDCRARGQQVAVAEIHHTAKPSNFTPVAPEGGNHTEGDSVVHPLPVLPQRQQENQIQDKGTCADEYIEVYHRTGTLV